MTDFNIQRALTDMESRLREDIQIVGQKVDPLIAGQAATKVEIANLKRKGDLVDYGIGVALLGTWGFIWAHLKAKFGF